MFPNKIDPSKFNISDNIIKGTRAWCSPVTYDGKTLELITPIMTLAFPLSSYQYPGKPKINYSISVELDSNNPNYKSLNQVIQGIDANTKKTFESDLSDHQFISSVKYSNNGKYVPTLRLKMVSNSHRFKCVIKRNGEYVSDEIEPVKRLLVKGVKLKLKIQLNPIWKVNKKYGVSYQVLEMDVMDPPNNKHSDNPKPKPGYNSSPFRFART